eukprot:tig00000607_g2519.t1
MNYDDAPMLRTARGFAVVEPPAADQQYANPTNAEADLKATIAGLSDGPKFCSQLEDLQHWAPVSQPVYKIVRPRPGPIASFAPGRAHPRDPNANGQAVALDKLELELPSAAKVTVPAVCCPDDNLIRGPYYIVQEGGSYDAPITCCKFQRGASSFASADDAARHFRSTCRSVYGMGHSAQHGIKVERALKVFGARLKAANDMAAPARSRLQLEGYKQYVADAAELDLAAFDDGTPAPAEGDDALLELDGDACASAADADWAASALVQFAERDAYGPLL